MKAVHLILGIPLFVFFALSVTLDLGSLSATYPESDLTPYLAAQSLAHDFDLSFTHEDSDRYFQERLQRPARFAVALKRILSSSGEYQETTVLYSPDLYVFVLAPFTALFRFHGVLVLHFLLIAVVYILGTLYYRAELDSAESAFNAVLYFTLVPLPILFLIPSHALMLFVIMAAAIFCGIRGREILCAALLGIAFSAQPWSLLFALLMPALWKQPDAAARTGRFAVALLVFVALAWGLESLMYPAVTTSQARWIADPLTRPMADVWPSLPRVDTVLVAAPRLQRTLDFLFGRTYGFLVYAFAAAAVLMASVWRLREPLIARALMFTALFLLATAFVHPSCLQVNLLAGDLWILLAPLPFFLLPMTRPRFFFAMSVVISCVFAGPLLVNPLGALNSRDYYLQSFPYRYFPVELSTVGKTGLTGNPAFRLAFSGGTIYFLNDNFYTERDFFWTRGESSLEFLLEMSAGLRYPRLQFENGTQENHLRVELGKNREELHLGAQETTALDLAKYSGAFREFDGRFYLHGKIETSSGYVPRLLSRDNSDYRFLGCRIHIIKFSQ